jgi:VWFA-related protein
VTRRLLLLLIAAIAASGQTAEQPQPAQDHAAARPMQVTATVETPQGRAIAGLRGADFELTVDGQRQPVGTATARTAGPRVIAILLDEFHVDAASTDRVREAAHRFVETRLRPDDRVVVLKPLDSLPEIHLTNDRDRLHDAIAAFEGRKGVYAPRSALEAETISRAPEAAETSRAQIVLSGLRALASRLGGQPGRAAILLVSDGFTRAPHLSEATALPDATVVERFANRFDVPVYAIDPDADGGNADARQTLEQLAARTGGFFDATGDVAAALDRAAAELDAGYILSFTPAHPADGRFHAIQIGVARRQAVVRSRAGYIAPPPPELLHARKSLDDPIVTTRLQRRSPFIEVWSGITRFRDARGHVVVTWEPGRGPAGLSSEATRVSLVATRPDGTVLYQGVLTPVRTTPIAGTAVRNSAEFDAPVGRVYLDMTIFGVRGQKLDVDARDLEVPAAGPAIQMLPPAILAARSAREFREAAADVDAPPDPGREFSRTTRLLIRVAAVGGSSDARITAQLLNRVGQTITSLAVVPDGPAGVTQFDLPLAPFAPGDYLLLMTATGPQGAAEQRVPIRVTG